MTHRLTLIRVEGTRARWRCSCHTWGDAEGEHPFSEALMGYGMHVKAAGKVPAAPSMVSSLRTARAHHGRGGAW